MSCVLFSGLFSGLATRKRVLNKKVYLILHQKGGTTMADFLNELASDSGLENHEAHHGVGAMLAFLKDRLNPEVYAHLKNAIPNSEQMLSAFQDKAESAGGGFLDALKGIAGKLFGEQGGAAPPDQSDGAALSADKLRSLMSSLHDMLAGKIPPHVLDQIKQHVPGFGPAAEHAEEK
jgi:hypothetical protein